jgi:hypothetical protein
MFRAHFHRSARKPVIMIGDAFVYHQAFTKAVGFCKKVSDQTTAIFAGSTSSKA